MGLIVLIIDCRPLTEAKTLRQQHAPTNTEEPKTSLHDFVWLCIFEGNLFLLLVPDHLNYVDKICQ